MRIDACSFIRSAPCTYSRSPSSVYVFCPREHSRLACGGVWDAPGAAPAGEIPVVAVVDLDEIESERVPPRRHTCLLDQNVVLLRRVEGPHFEVGLLQFMKAGRQSP